MHCWRSECGLETNTALCPPMVLYAPLDQRLMQYILLCTQYGTYLVFTLHQYGWSGSTGPLLGAPKVSCAHKVLVGCLADHRQPHASFKVDAKMVVNHWKATLLVFLKSRPPPPPPPHHPKDFVATIWEAPFCALIHV